MRLSYPPLRPRVVEATAFSSRANNVPMQSRFGSLADISRLSGTPFATHYRGGVPISCAEVPFHSEGVVMLRNGTGTAGHVLERFAIWVTHWTGSSWAFALAALMTLLWLVSGPFFHYSDTWQLVMNTISSIVTFLMVFLLQR